MSTIMRMLAFVLGAIGLFFILGTAPTEGIILVLIGALILVWVARAEKNAEKEEEREWRKQMLEAQQTKNSSTNE